MGSSLSSGLSTTSRKGVIQRAAMCMYIERGSLGGINGLLTNQMMSRRIHVLLRMTWAGSGKEAVSIWGPFQRDFNEHDWSEIEDMMHMASELMECQDNCNDVKGYYLYLSNDGRANSCHM